MESLMKTVTLNMIVIKPLQGSFNRSKEISRKDVVAKECLLQGFQTRSPRGHFVRPAMFFGNFEIIKHLACLVYS